MLRIGIGHFTSKEHVISDIRAFDEGIGTGMRVGNSQRVFGRNPKELGMT
jgi:hypothetical protein